MKVDRTDFEVWIYDSGYFMKSLNLKDKIFELVEKILNKEISIMDLKRFQYKFIVYKIAFAYCLHFKDKQIEKLEGERRNASRKKSKNT